MLYLIKLIVWIKGFFRGTIYLEIMQTVVVKLPKEKRDRFMQQ